MKKAHSLFIFLIGLSLSSSVFAEEQVPEDSKQTEASQRVTNTTSILNELVSQIEIQKQQISKTSDPEEKKALEAQLKNLENQFDLQLIGNSALLLNSDKVTQKSFGDELFELARPVLNELKSATSDSRDKETLRTQIDDLEKRQKALANVTKRIEKQRSVAAEQFPELIPVLEDELKFWENKKKQASLLYSSAQNRLAEKESESSGFVEVAYASVSDFFKTRGLRLFVAILVAIATYFLIWYAYRQFSKVSPTHKSKYSSEGAVRTMEGVIRISASFSAVLSVLLTFFLFDDWFLLTLTLFILAATFWSLKDKIAEIAEEIRLILNIGSVREGERIIFNGLPWIVDKISVYSILKNPNLTGGRLRLPLSHLVGQYSRPTEKAERYFPTDVNNWVTLSDDTFGKVIRQTPEYVTVLRLGGTRKTYTTADFLGSTPINLSLNGFRVKSRFGIDYDHQALSTEEIPNTLQTFVHNGLVKYFEDRKLIGRVKVEFASAGASSLDLDIIADFDSELAPKHDVIERLLQRLAVDACNENGWGIPFAQLTIHQADSPQES